MAAAPRCGDVFGAGPPIETGYSTTSLAALPAVCQRRPSVVTATATGAVRWWRRRTGFEEDVESKDGDSATDLLVTHQRNRIYLFPRPLSSSSSSAVVAVAAHVVALRAEQ